MLDVSHIQKDFPLLTRKINGKPIIYLDTTASSLKPSAVLEAVENYYKTFSVNIFRGLYTLSEEATEAYENARKRIGAFINAPAHEVVFVRNATEGINLVAAAWGESSVGEGDAVVSTVMEHHANIVPWQVLCTKKNAQLLFLDIDDAGKLLVDDTLPRVVTERTKLVALTAVSNVLGTINPVKDIASRVKEINPSCLVLVDAAQAVPHMPVDVKDLGCDFLVFSGHKMYGPTGIGVLWGKQEILETMPPYQTGGEMIDTVTLEVSTYKDPPYRFEAGTPHIAGAIGLAAAADYLTALDMNEVRRHERMLTGYALQALGSIQGLKIYGPQEAVVRGGVISFTMQGIHPHDLSEILNRDNICIRSGHHCAMPLHTRLSIPASARASFSIYNTTADIDKLVVGIQKAIEIFKP